MYLCEYIIINYVVLQFHADSTGLYTALKRCVRKYSLDNGDLLWEYVLKDGRSSTINTGTVVNRINTLINTGTYIKYQFLNYLFK